MSRYGARHIGFDITFEEAARKYTDFNTFSMRLGLQPVKGNYFCEMWSQKNKLVNTRTLLVPEDVYMLIKKKTFSGSELSGVMKAYEKELPRTPGKNNAHFIGLADMKRWEPLELCVEMANENYFAFTIEYSFGDMNGSRLVISRQLAEKCTDGLSVGEMMWLSDFQKTYEDPVARKQEDRRIKKVLKTLPRDVPATIKPGTRGWKEFVYGVNFDKA